VWACLACSHTPARTGLLLAGTCRHAPQGIRSVSFACAGCARLKGERQRVVRVVAQRKAVEEQRTQVWQRPVRQENLALGGMTSNLV